MTNDTANAKTIGRTEAPLPEAVTSGRAGVSTDDRVVAGATGSDAEDADSPPSSAHSRRRFSRFRSVRKKATSFSGWRSSVKWMTAAEDEHGSIEALAKGTHLWKVRRKKLQGVVCYRRKYKVQFTSKECDRFLHKISTLLVGYGVPLHQLRVGLGHQLLFLERVGEEEEAKARSASAAEVLHAHDSGVGRRRHAGGLRRRGEQRARGHCGHCRGQGGVCDGHLQRGRQERGQPQDSHSSQGV